MCRLCRRGFLTGLSALGAHTALPAWAQFGNAIQPQNDPWAQVDPYADARNGFPGSRPPEQRDQNPARTVFEQRPAGGNLAPEVEEEIRMGRSAYPYWIRKSGGAHPDQRLQAALREFCKPMFAAADRADLPWVVTLVVNPDPNASAGAGGTVTVHTGMLSICDHPGELAATLAHEIGHVDKKHSVNRGDLSRVLDAMRNAGIKPAGGDTMTSLVPEAEGVFRDYFDLLNRVYGKENEAEADAHEMVILERLGIDPVHAINDQKNFLLLGKLNGDMATRDGWLRTHPPTPARLQHVEALAALSPRPRREYKFAGWDTLKAAFPTAQPFKKS